MFNTVIIEKYGIYDIFYNTDNEYIIITNNTNNLIINLVSEDKLYLFSFYTAKGQYEANPHIYKLTYNMYLENIDILINDEIITVKVNKYPNMNNRIIISTMVRFEDNYILQFIEYYKHLGIDKFIIYDNSKNPKHYYEIESSLVMSSDLPNILSNYIDDGTVVLIDWPFTTIDGLKNRQQEAQQNHSLYAFKDSKLIGFFDIDEYINPQININTIDSLINNVLNENKIDIMGIGGLALYSKFFKNPNNYPESRYDFLKIYTCLTDVQNTLCEIQDTLYKNPIKFYANQKCFINPRNVAMFQVHFVIDGKEPLMINKEYAYINHYIFLNKNNRGRDNKDPIVYDDSINNHTKFIES